MSTFLGIDTSNYTTSTALFDSANANVVQIKKPLPVKKGEIGLRQSDAVFHHTVQLPEIIGELSAAHDLSAVLAVGVSVSPRNTVGSYMPCFLPGITAATYFAAAKGIPLYKFSHQQGHIAAALFSSDKLNLMNEKFLAFHVSGGTTDAVLVTPDDDSFFSITPLAASLDLKAGQAVDRVGAMLGLSFPSGKELDLLSQNSSRSFKIKPSLKGSSCSLSGIENNCKKMLQNGEPPEDIAKYCIEYICASLDKMCEILLKEQGNLPVVFSGGVMCNSIIKTKLTAKYGAFFAAPEFSADNAAGVAVLASMCKQN